MRTTSIVCETVGCTQRHDHDLTTGPADQALHQNGWLYEAGKWYCPGCKTATEALRAEQNDKTKNKWS